MYTRDVNMGRKSKRHIKSNKEAFEAGARPMGAFTFGDTGTFLT